MKYLFLLLLIGCGTTKPTPQPTPVPPIVVYDTVHIKSYDTIHVVKIETVVDSISVLSISGSISVKDFFAMGDGSSDDYLPIINACNYCIANPKICTQVRFPIGNYKTTKSILLQNNGKYFTIKLTGDVSNKSSSDPYLSKITYTGTGGYAIGIQYGRSVEIENLTILGQYTFPYSVNNYNIGTLKFADWAVPNITDSRYKPYAGIVIDPDTNVSGTRGGTSDVTIKNCSIKQWMVGICLTPNGVTQNDEMINILEDNIDACRVAIAVCQDQAKTINIKGLKVWTSVHTVLDGLTYGIGTGGGSVFCENWNIAGNVNELFNLTVGRFPLSAINLYSESLFRIGTVGSGTVANFINSEFDFLSGHNMPAADYLINGPANFYGGSIRYYDDSYNHRMNFVNFAGAFRDMTLNNPLITRGLYGIPTNHYKEPKLDNVNYFYTAGSDSLVNIPFITDLIVDRVSWTANCTCSNISVGDYILAAPTNKTGSFYDTYLNHTACPTIQIGRVTTVTGSHVTLDDVGLNAYSGEGYDAFYIDRIK